MHIPHTVLYTFPLVLTRRICLTIRSSSLVGDHFLYSCHLDVWLRGEIVRRKYMLITLWSPRVKTIFFSEKFILIYYSSCSEDFTVKMSVNSTQFQFN